MNNDEKIRKLEREVAELLKWKEQRTRQQITFPLDKQSDNVLNKYFAKLSDAFILFGFSTGNRYLRATQGTKEGFFRVDTTQQVTVNPTTNVFTLLEGTVANDQAVYVLSTESLPTPLATTSAFYYVISTSGQTFKLSSTIGGAEIDVTDTGVGIIYILKT